MPGFWLKVGAWSVSGTDRRQPLLFPDAQVGKLDILIGAFLPFVELVSCLLVKVLKLTKHTNLYRHLHRRDEKLIAAASA